MEVFAGVQDKRLGVYRASNGITTVMGYFMGRSSYMHRPTAVVAGITGFGFGICYGLQNSMGRQMGLCENEAESQTA